MPQAPDAARAVTVPELPTDLGPAEYMRLAREIRAGAGDGLVPLKVGFLSTFSFQFVDPFFVVEAARSGIRAETYFGGFGQLEQEVVDAESGLRSFEPQVLVLALRPEDLDADALVRHHAGGARRLSRLAAELVSRIGSLIEAFRSWSEAPVLVSNFTLPARLPMGPFDANMVDGLTYAIAEANARLRDRVAQHGGSVIWDYHGLVRARGAEGWADPRLWALARIPVSAENQPHVARHLVRTLNGVRRRPAKALVLDLDNTLWGGILGDDGLEGIQLGDDYPGVVYKSFQRAVLSLMDRGILLAVASKNDPAVVDRALREHPEMLIRWEHLAAARVNWAPKSRNIREIAEELNIGSDALVLFDDNPVERAEVQANAPEVGVIDVPPDPLRYEEALWSSGFFDRSSLSDEDRRRAGMYRAERERRSFARRFETVEEFLRNLAMRAEVGTADASTLGRITQLINKTNQFNLTTRRYSAAELGAMSEDPSCVVAWIRVRDRFGDQGLVGVGILRKEGDVGRIDSFLMSCRMMNRRVEDALLAYLAERARKLGCRRLIGEYLPTRKNAPVRDLYDRFGFAAAGSVGAEGRRYELPIDERAPEWPDVIERIEAGPLPVVPPDGPDVEVQPVAQE